MASATNFVRAGSINFWLRGNPTAITAPTAVKLALYSTATDATGGGTEIVAGGYSYARQTITFDDPAGTGDSVNSIAATFSNWPGVAASHWAIHNTTGQMLFFGAFSSAQNTGAGTTLTIVAADLAMQVR